MKLHLPKGLRAALIAAFAAIGTLAQAGITTYDVTSWASYNPTAGAAVVGNGIAQTFDYTQTFNSNWNFVVTVNAASIQNDSALTLLALSLQQSGGTGLAEGITLADNGTPTATLTSWSSAAAGGAQTLDLTDVTTLTFVLTRTEDKNLTMKVYADDNFSSAIATATQGGQSFSGTTVDHVALGGTGGMSRYNHSANQVTFPADTGTGTFEITKAGYLFNSVVSENDLIKYYNPPSTLVWNSTSSATWDLSTANWVAEGDTTPIVFADYASAVFGSGSSLVKSVEVEGSVNVDVMTVQDNYTFTAGSGSALMMDALNVAAGKTVTLAGEGYFDITHLGGNISIAAEATVDLGDIITLSATQPLPVSGEGRLGLSTLKVEGGEHTITNALEVMGGGDGTGSTNRSLGLAVTNAAANITLLGDTHITGALYAQVGTVNIGNGTDAVRVETNRVEFGDTGGSGTSTLNVNKNATLHVRAGDVPKAYASTGLVMGEWGGVSVANIYGKLYADNATAYVGDNTVTFNIQEGGLMAVKGFSQNEHKAAKTETVNLNLLDGGTVVLGDNGIASQKPINVNFAAGEVGISGFDVEIAKDVTLSGSGTTFNTTVYEWQGTDNTLELVLGEDIGTITVRGNITGDGAIIKTGGGALVLAGDANVITHTITLQEGELVLWGAYDVSALAGGSEEDYVDGEVEGNGFLSHGELIAHVVDIAADTSLSSDGIFTVNGAEGSFDTATGNATFGSGTSYTTLYVNVASTAEGLAHAMETAAAQGAQIGDVRLANNTTLNMNSAAAVLPLLTVAADADAAVNVTESAAITKVTGASAGHTLTINGTDGTMLTIGATATDSFVSTGNLVINEGSTVLLQGNNTNFTGNIEVNGTLMVGTGINANVGTGVFGAENIAATSTRTFTINSTGVLDLNGQPDTKYAYVLAGGKITNSGNDIPEGKAQMSGLKLTQDSTVEAGNGHEFWLLSAGYAANTAELQGHTLVKTGDGRFGFKTSSITEGTLEAREGIIHFSGANTVADMLLTGGTYTGSVDVKDDITVTTRATATMTAALNITDAGKVVTFSVDEGKTHTQSGAVGGSGSITKEGAGTLELSAANTLASVSLSEGTLKATKAGALGSGPVTVNAGATLELTVGNVLSGTQAINNSGTVLIHNTLTGGTMNGGVLMLAADFPVDGDLEDVGGTTTGNGFSQGGVMHVYDPTKATLTGTFSVKQGDTDYTTQMDEHGDISTGGADWTTYLMKAANPDQPTIKEIMEYADTQSGGTGTLQHIVVSESALSLVDDSDAFKTSMLGGDKLNSLIFVMVDGASLGMDADLANSLMFGSENGDAAAEIVLEKDAAINGAIWAYTAEGGVANLTVRGAHTLTLDEVDLTHGIMTVQDDAKVAAGTIAPEGGDSVVVKDTAELVLAGGSISIKSVDGAKDATLTSGTGAEYDIGSADYTIGDALLTLNFSAAHNFGHTVSGDVTLVNAGTSSVNDTNAANTKYAGLHAQNGNIYLANKTAVTVGDLTVGEGRTVGSQLLNDVAITVNGKADFGSNATVGSALTMAAGSTLDGSAALASHALTLNKGVNIGTDLWTTLSGLAAEESTNLFTGVSALTLAGAEYSGKVDLTEIFTHENLKKNKYSLTFEGGNVIITKELENNRYWKGGDGTWNYTTATVWTDEEDGGADAAFVSGYNAHFTATTGGTVTLGEDITAASITVSGADYTFAPGGHSLTVTNSVEADGHKATFNLALTGENLALTATKGGTIALNAANSVKSVNIGTGSSVTVAAMRSLAVADSFVNDGTLTAAGASVTLSKGTAKGGNATVGTLNLASGQSYTFGNLTAATVNGTGANLTIGAANTLMVTGNSTVATLTLGNSATVAGTGTVTATDVTLQGDAAVSGKLTTGSLAGTGKLSLNGGTLTFTGTAAPAASLATGGTSTIATSGTGVTLTFKGTVDNAEGGTVTFTGSFDVGNCTTTDGSAKYVEGGSTDNGFKQAQKIVSVIDEGAADGSGATLTYKGKSIGAMDSKGKVTFEGDTDYTKYYVNSGTENASTAMNNAKWTLTSTFELAAGTTLVVDKNIDMDMVNVATGKTATMQIESGSTVTTDGTAKALTLKGAGTLALNSGVSATGVTLDDAWAGTVSFTEAALTTLDGAWKSGSTVSLTGVTGSVGDTAIDAAIVLNKGTDDWGYGQTTAGTRTLNGTITGEGNLGVKSGTATSIFELNGNTADWTGNFIVDTAADVTLSLGGDAKTINGSVSGSNLTLKLKTDATLKSDSTVARVNATAGSLKVDAGKTLTVTDTILPDNIKLGAGASIAAAFMGGTEYGYMDGTIANETGGDQDVTINNADITVTGATLCTGGGTGFTVDNKLVDAKLLVAETLTKAVALNNVQDSLEVAGDLAIGAGGSLKVANGTSKQEVVIGTDSTLTTSAGAAVDANLTLSQGTTADMGGALAMNGGALTLNKGITLAGGLYDAVNALSVDGSYVNLFTGVKALTLGTDTYTEPVKALQYFTNLSGLSDKGDYFLKYEDGNVFISFTPTTASTLTWNGTEDRHTWEQGTGSAENWLEGDPAVPTHFTEGDNANFTPDAAKKLVTIDEDITARNITVSGGTRYIFENAEASTITAEQFAVKDSALGKKGAGKLVLDIDTAVSLTNGAFAVQEGDVEIGTADKAGELAMVGSSMLDIAPGASLTVATIHADDGPAMELGGTLTVANGSLVYITALDGSTLRIADVGTTTAGTLTVGADTYLYGLENHGTLDLGTRELTLMEKTAQGGNVTAGRLTLAETGSTFGDLKANIIQYGLASADDATLDAEAPNLVVKTIAANGIFPVITLDLTETMHGAGSLAPIQRLGEATTYTLVHATGQDLNASLFTLGGALETLVQNGLVHADAGLVVDHRDVKLTIGGLDLTWYTGKDETEWGYSVVSGGDIAHGANTLNGVQHVVVDADRTVDVSGVGSEPGLRVRNITGASGRTIAFTGTKDDTVNLIATEDTTSSVGVAAENVTIQVGLKELDEMDPADYAALHVGDVDLSGATLAVTPQADFTVDTLNGNADSKIKGQVSVAGRGGAYRGGYEGAYVALDQDASQTLYAGEGLTVAGAGEAKLAYTGHETHMDGIEGIGMTVVLNDPAHDNSGTTLVLDNNSRLSSGTLVSGMSAINSALTLDTNKAPELVRAGSLKMDGSTLVINQDAADQGSIAMEIRGTAGAQGLCLALIGGQDTYTDDVVLNGYLYQKYYENARLEAGRLLVDRRTDFFRTVSGAHTPNGIAGVQMLDAAIDELNPQVTNPAGDLAAVMTALETGAVANPDRVAAAMAGSSAAALGHAFGNDVQRQLRTIRNRTTTMGLSDCSVSEDLPYINAWVNAEGDHRKLDADGTLAGYTLSSWGGTVGCDVDLTNRLTLGAAFTVMHGDFSSRSADVCSGDLDREYVSVFARYARRAWTNTLVATLGFADSKLDRTVNYGAGGYTARDDADGSAFGLLYELGYTKALNEDASTCLQPVFNVSYRHSSLGGYTEKGAGDAALCVGDADMDTVTFGLGARLQSVVGTSVYNRSSLFEGRVLLKLDSGDRDATVHNRFAGVRNGADTKSAEVGAFGVEVGAGITLPVAEDGGAIFIDVTGEFRSGYSEVNGTAGYRFNF